MSHKISKFLTAALVVCASAAAAFAQQPAPQENGSTATKTPETYVEVRRITVDVMAVDGFGQQSVASVNQETVAPAPPTQSVQQIPAPTTSAQQPAAPPGTTTQQPAPSTPPVDTTIAQPSSQPQGPAVQATQGVTPPASSPGQTVAPPPGVSQPGRESVPTAAPADVQIKVPPVAAGYEARSGPLPELGRVGVEMADQRPLSIREAIEMALGNNKDIAVARQNVRVAEFDLQGARGVYDPRFTASSYYDRTETPTASFLSGTSSGAITQSGFYNNMSFIGQTPTGGGNYRFDFSNSRSTTNNPFAALNPQYPSALTASYTQPLLRGLRFDQNRRLIAIAQKNLSLTDAQFRQRAIETITGVQRAYWDLVFSLRNLQIQRDAVRDARSQLEHNRRLVEQGVLAPIDVVAADAQVSGFEQSLYSALDDVGRAENALKNLIAENSESPLWSVAIVPTDPVDLQSPPVALPEAMEAAMRTRPELRASDVAREINEIEQRFAREQTRPQVDLVGSYGLVGLAGSARNDNDAINPFTASTQQLRDRINELSLINGLPPLPETPPQTLPDVLIGGIGQSFANLAANRFTNFRVGVQVNIPFRNRTAQAQLGRSLVERERIATQREQLEQLIQVDVRNALQLIRTAESRLRSAAVARNASEQQYASEQRKFDAGQSTFFLVLERQTALTTARGNELRAQTELNKAVAELQRATGNTLEANRVEVSAR